MRIVRGVLKVLAVIIAFAGAATLLVLPAPAAPATPGQFTRSWPVARGAYHVHSRRSDGTGTIDEIAQAAAAAGLQFVVLTDHGDGTREPEPPSYRSGVLCLDGVEISTQYGHYVAVGMGRTPYPLAGHPRDVIEDVRRFGGFGFAAHPGSPKAALRWDDWSAPFDGLEWLNADSEWRDEVWGSLGGVLLTYAFRPTETLAGLLDRPADVLAHWDRAARRRRVPALAGADAHARLGYRQSVDPYEDRVFARLPSYEASFRAFTNRLVLDAPLTGDAARDSPTILTALKEGRSFTSIDGLAGLDAFEAKAASGARLARIGDYLDFDGTAAIEARIAAPAGTTLVVLRDGEPVYDTAAGALRLDVGTEAGAYRIEARLPARMRSPTVPWVLTNPIYIGLRGSHTTAETQVTGALSERAAVATALWKSEASAGSASALARAALADNTPALEWRFTLAGGPKGEQYAAAWFPAGPELARFDRLQLRAQSDAPRRLWAQLRAPGGQSGERWGRSFYVDASLGTINLKFDEFRPLGRVSSAAPPRDRIDSLLLVVDTLNTMPGTSGRLLIPDLWLAR